MFDKLDALANRYAELSEAIAQPEVIRDFPRYQACLKERSGLEPVIGKYNQYLRVEQQIADVRELLSDPLMASEAGAELSSLDAEREKLLDELRLLLVPPDPLDSRKKAQELQEMRNALLSELDTQIKVSNATTMIEF